MKSGIYCIKNIVTNKVYVGKAEDIKTRWSQHREQLRNRKHINKEMVQDCIDYGIKSFKFEVLEEIDNTQENFDEYLAIRERVWGDKLNARGIGVGYNILDFYCGDLTQEEIEERNKRPNQKPDNTRGVNIKYFPDKWKDVDKTNLRLNTGAYSDSNLRAEICTNFGLSYYIIYITLVSLANEKGKSYVSMEELHRMTGIGISTIKLNIKVLYDYNYIIVNSGRKGKSNEYWFPKEKFFDPKDEEMLSARKKVN